MQNYKKNLRYARKKIKKENIMRKGRLEVGASEESIAGLNPAQRKKETRRFLSSKLGGCKRGNAECGTIARSAPEAANIRQRRCRTQDTVGWTSL